jgi:hypothetical protein
MKKLSCGLAVLAVLLSPAAPAYAWRHGRIVFGTGVFVGGPFWGGCCWGRPWWGPGWGWDPFWYPPPYYSYAPPVVIREEPQVYVQQPPAHPAPQSEEASYWYYCADAKAYYPYVQQCPAGWLKVVPQTASPGR